MASLIGRGAVASRPQRPDQQAGGALAVRHGADICDPDKGQAELGQAVHQRLSVLAEAVSEPVDEQAERINRQLCLAQARRLLGEMGSATEGSNRP